MIGAFKEFLYRRLARPPGGRHRGGHRPGVSSGRADVTPSRAVAGSHRDQALLSSRFPPKRRLCPRFQVAFPGIGGPEPGDFVAGGRRRYGRDLGGYLQRPETVSWLVSTLLGQEDVSGQFFLRSCADHSSRKHPDGYPLSLDQKDISGQSDNVQRTTPMW